MKRAFFVASVMSLCGIGIGLAHGNQAVAALDRVIPEGAGGGPFALTSPLPNWSDGVVLAVGRAASIVIGFEAAPEVKEVGTVSTPEIGAYLKAAAERGHRVSLAGKTVREALDTIVSIDPRYRWIDMHGVPVVRPWASWTDPRHPLNQVVAPIAWKDVDLARASANVMALVTHTEEPGGPVPGSGKGPVFTVETRPIAILELLNAIGQAHGGAVGWYMLHRCTIPRAIYIHLHAYDGSQVWGLGTCRAVSQESRQ